MTTDAMRLGRICLVVLLASIVTSIVLPASLSAQDTGPQPEPGDRIRFLAPLVHPSFVESDLVRLDTDTLRATGLSEPARRYAIARTEIERIELRMTESRTFLGAGIGAGVGIVAGTAFMAAFCDSPDSACDTGEFVRGVLIIALPPALVGAVIGSAVNSERWMPLEP